MIATQLKNQEQLKFSKLNQEFKVLKLQLKKITKQKSGTFIAESQNSFQTIYPEVDIQKNVKHKIFVSSFVKNNNIVLNISINLAEYWHLLCEWGINKIIKKITEYHCYLKGLEIYQFSQATKKISTKIIIGQITQFLPEFCNIIAKSTKRLMSILSQDLRSLKQGQKLKQINFVKQMMQRQITKQSKTSQTLSFMEKYSKQDASQQKNKMFDKMTDEYQKRLKKTYKKEDKIFRCIKQVQINRKNEWKNQEGNYGIVEKCYAIYKIRKDISVHNEATIEMKMMHNRLMQDVKQKVKNKSAIDDENNLQNETEFPIQEIQIQSYLVKKFLDETDQSNIMDKKSSFLIQKKLLYFLRDYRCEAINNFYFVENSNFENSSYIYSDYQSKKITYYESHPKKSLKILYTLSNGLLFLRWYGISHRDLKPDNILLSKLSIPKIIDFGSGCHNKFYKAPELNKKQNEFSRSLNGKIQAEQLKTNRQYNLVYSRLPANLKQQTGSTSFTFNRHQYESHQNFDIYAFGVLLGQLMCTAQAKKHVGNTVYQLCKYLSNSCMEPNPDDRPNPRSFSPLLRLILQLMKIETQLIQ